MIRKKRIRNVPNYMGHLNPNETFYLGVILSEETQEKIMGLGFSLDDEISERLLPSANWGAVSRFNSFGSYKLLKNLPKEPYNRQREWRWQQWAPGGGVEERVEIIDVQYMRYQREEIPAPLIELSSIRVDESYWIISPSFTYNEPYFNAILHSVNLMLEIFGHCEILNERFVPNLPIVTRRLNWDLLPIGEYPWERVSERVNNIVLCARPGNRNIIYSRINPIQNYNPEFVAVGKNGFHGYIVFGFTNRNLFILESIYTGNATYIFRENWEEFSQLTKAQILREGLHLARWVHNVGWINSLTALFNANPN